MPNVVYFIKHKTCSTTPSCPECRLFKCFERGICQIEAGQEALGCFQQMQREGGSPNTIIYACIMKACGIMQDADMGKRTHNDIVSQGLLEKNDIIGTTLACMQNVVHLRKHKKCLRSLLFGAASLGMH
ncbi:hypothetical protein GOP47_0005653 [Adiantum capillus-veneris]|uniref:Pentatricopeptide repeat-containing protein n=1 Tax=Adiantum capillus-veneris TaxID=13818 RepID=A0A9D4V5J1_ADICA|nr:hypothetical protein GOP47_0005653 [Adiantum capillus-veneris]